LPGRSSRNRIELFFLLFAAALGYGADDLRADVPKSWRVGMAAWDGTKLAASEEYLRFGLPLQIRDKLAGIRSRELDPEERTALARLLARRKADALGTQLIDSNKARDDIVFKHLPETEAARSLAAIEDRRSAIAESLLRFTGSLPHLEVIPASIPIAFEPTELLPAPVFAPVEAARKSGVDILVSGRLEPLDGYLYWRVAAYSVLLGREIFSAERVSTAESISDALDDVVAGLAEALLGRPWAALSVRPMPANASVRVDGQVAGVGSVELRYLEPGAHHVEVSFEGHATYGETIFLEPSRQRRLDVALEPLPTRPVTLTSDPLGALVYRDSLYIGTTPLDLAMPAAGLLTYRLEHEGYYETYTTVDSSGPTLIGASLKRRLADPTEWQEIKRKRFYRSLGALALSVPIGIVSYAIALDAATARNNTLPGSEDYDTLTQRATLAYAVYLGGLFTSIVLGVNMAFDLGEYVRYADDPEF
jgi:hypothetical protein